MTEPASSTDRQFPAARLGHRGLDAEAVYAWCGEAVTAMARLDGQLGELSDQYARVLDQNTQLRDQNARQASHVLRRAQQTAEDMMGNARGEARQYVEDARQQYAETIGAAREKAERIVAEGLEGRDQLIAAAEREADLIRRQAPEDARGEVTRWKALAMAERDGLTAQLEGLLARTRAWAAEADAAGLPPMGARHGAHAAGP